MKCRILHETKGRMRVHLNKLRLTLDEADTLEFYLRSGSGVTKVSVFDRTADVIIYYTAPRSEIIRALSAFSFNDEAARELVPQHTGRALSRNYENELVNTIIFHYARRLLLPAPLRAAWAVINSVRYIKKGVQALLSREINVSVLDASAVTLSILRNDFGTASSIMFLLKIGEILEEWTHKKSVDDLAMTMSLGVDKVWLKTEDGAEVLVPVNQLKVGDHYVVRMGNMIPLDGKVISGEASVNQASITGESMPVVKSAGGYVYAGTILEEGECEICVDKVSGSAKYDRIVRMIEESEKLKSAAEDKASNLADKLVPYSFIGTALTYAFTRNVTRALSFMMVDFSCALKLAMPISVLSAIKECSIHNITVKGGRYLEAVSKADTIVFDKTGTLTLASPHVVDVVSFDGADADEMLRIAACLEEHYPHSMANAVVNEALVRNLQHKECHTNIGYTVAHGISGDVAGRKTIIGSYHFVFEDENCKVPEAELDKFNALPAECSHLYMAQDGVLKTVICIEDPIRPEAKSVIDRLHELGFTNIVMMTGDSERTARAVSEKLGLDEYHAEVLPEDKAAFVRKARQDGHKVIMIGDGINDSPALSEADAGIAINSGAAIAKEIADITVSANDIGTLITLREISAGLNSRIDYNYRFIMGFNMGLIGAGVAGILQPASTALLHNISTIGISLKSMTPLLEEK